MNKWKRNPRVFNGEYITVTRRDDGSLRPNFKPIKTGKGFDVVRYAMAVSNELLWALDGLVEERVSRPMAFQRFSVSGCQQGITPSI